VSVRLRALAVVATVAAGTASCASTDAYERVGEVEQEAQPVDRFLVGAASAYPADRALRERLPALEASMAERRRVAWSVIGKVLAPIAITAQEPGAAKRTLPRFQTWYSREDVLPMFDRLFRALPAAERSHHPRFSERSIDAVFPWNARGAPTLPSFTQERLEARRAELRSAAGLHSLGKDARVLMSPGYVAHVLRSYPELLGCDLPLAGTPPPSPTNFAPCLPREFPVDAAAVKMRWVRGGEPMPTYDTSPAPLAKKLAAGTFGAGDGAASPGESDVYTMQLTADTSMRLAGLHIMTKELRDWMWITLWWSDDADHDFGADRPASIAALGGPWKNYKMCVVTGFEEHDVAARLGGSDPASWCSNPYLEDAERAAQTNCIGCHQHGGTPETTDSVLAVGRFPSNGRSKVRANFPVDYAFTTSAGLELTSQLRARVEALTPASPTLLPHYPNLIVFPRRTTARIPN